VRAACAKRLRPKLLFLRCFSNLSATYFSVGKSLSSSVLLVWQGPASFRRFPLEHYPPRFSSHDLRPVRDHGSICISRSIRNQSRDSPSRARAVTLAAAPPIAGTSVLAPPNCITPGNRRLPSFPRAFPKSRDSTRPGCQHRSSRPSLGAPLLPVLLHNT